MEDDLVQMDATGFQVDAADADEPNPEADAIAGKKKGGDDGDGIIAILIG